MVKKFAIVIITMIMLVLLSPMFVYWWGLSNIEQPLIPSQKRLSPELELAIWQQEKQVGAPRVKPISIYGYIGYLHCFSSNYGEAFPHKCMNKYPGLRIANFAVRKQVGERVGGQGNTVYQLTGLAYSIWATQHWDIHQILATYYDTYQKEWIKINENGEVKWIHRYYWRSLHATPHADP